MHDYLHRGEMRHRTNPFVALGIHDPNNLVRCINRIESLHWNSMTNRKGRQKSFHLKHPEKVLVALTYSCRFKKHPRTASWCGNAGCCEGGILRRRQSLLYEAGEVCALDLPVSHSGWV